MYKTFLNIYFPDLCLHLKCHTYDYGNDCYRLILYGKSIYSTTWILHEGNWSANCIFHQIIVLDFTTPAINLGILNLWENFVLGDKVFTLQDTSTIPGDLYTHHRFYMPQHTLVAHIARIRNSIKIEPTILDIFSFTDIIQHYAHLSRDNLQFTIYGRYMLSL